MAAETIAIIEAGRYRSPGGRDVDLGNSVRAAVGGLPAVAGVMPRAPGTAGEEVAERGLLVADRLPPVP